MKIVTRAQLMAMPAGTLFHEWEPCNCGVLQIKGETRGPDFYTTAVPEIEARDSDEGISRQIEMREKGVSYPIDLEAYGREGLFDDRLLYAVWERADVAALHAKLGAILAWKVGDVALLVDGAGEDPPVRVQVLGVLPSGEYDVEALPGQPINWGRAQCDASELRAT